MKKIIIASALVLLGLANGAGAVTSVEISNSLKTSPVTDDLEIIVKKESGVVGKAFILDATKSQDDGVVRSFLWKQVSGPTVKLSDANSVRLSVVPTVAGTYVFELVVIDTTGLSSVAQKAELKITGDPAFDLKATPKTSDTADWDKLKLLDENKDGKIIGDDDFDFLDISVGSDDAKKLRTESVNNGANENWNLGETDKIKTSADLKTYVDAVVLNDDAIEDVKVTKDTIEVKSKEQGRLLWFIPVSMNLTVTIKYSLSDSTEDRADVSVRLPWWHVFVGKSYNGPADVRAEIVAGFQKIEWTKIDNTDTVTDANIVSKMLQTVSNVLKTKRDTAKNSIGNIR